MCKQGAGVDMKVLIFGGTTEGRYLAMALTGAGIDVTLSVATEYGRSTASTVKSEIITNRLDKRLMSRLFKEGSFDCVVDATHPYAILATQNIRLACRDTDSKYYRLKRAESAAASGATYVKDAATAARLLGKTNEKALLTIGSKSLEPFTHVQDFAERLFVRIIPSPDSLVVLS